MLNSDLKNIPLWTKISLSKIRIPWLIFTLLVFTGLIKLGIWQNTRAIEKEVRLNRIITLNKQSAMSLLQVVDLNNELSIKTSTDSDTKNTNINKNIIPNDYINDFPVYINGTFDSQFMFFLDNQPNKGALGYRVLQVAKAGPYYVLVNLGWVQGSIDRNILPDIMPLSGQYQFNGHIRLVEQGIMLMEQIFSKDHWPLRVQQIELEKFSTLIGQQLLPFVVYLDKNEGLGYTKNWQAIVMPPEKHRAYAFQWFSLAAAWLILMIWVSGIFSSPNSSSDTNKNKNNNKA